jgi:hypothetical protein
VLAATIPPLPTTYPALAETWHKMHKMPLQIYDEDAHVQLLLGGALSALPPDGALGLEVHVSWWSEAPTDDCMPPEGKLDVSLCPEHWDAPTPEACEPGPWCEHLAVMAARAAASFAPFGHASGVRALPAVGVWLLPPRCACNGHVAAA